MGKSNLKQISATYCVNFHLVSRVKTSKGKKAAVIFSGYFSLVRKP